MTIMFAMWLHGPVVITTVHFILQSLNSESVQVQILLVACRRFAMVRISGKDPGWIQGFTPSVSQPCHNHNSRASSSLTLITLLIV